MLGRGVRVGNEYQATCPNIIPQSERRLEQSLAKAQIVWSPTEKLSDEELGEYITAAKEGYKYNSEVAMRILYRHRYDLELAYNGLDVFTEFPNSDIRIGDQYQTVCPVYIPQAERRPEELVHNAQLIWLPTPLPDEQLFGYIAMAKEYYGYSAEQAMRMLFRHKHDIFQAINGLQIFTPFPTADIEIGNRFQAVCPDFIPEAERRPEDLIHRAELLWSPTDISDENLDNFAEMAKERHGYSTEQALGMLFWHKHDMDRATHDLQNFTPYPDEWPDEDKMLFYRAFQVHGKSFHRINQMVCILFRSNMIYL